MTTTPETLKQDARLAAIAYIRKCLAAGNSLSKHLLASLNLEAGRITALSAVPLDAAEATEYTRGHDRSFGTVSQQPLASAEISWAARPTPSALAELASIVGAALDEQDDLCLLENPLARGGDPWLARSRSRLLLHDGEVYHALTAADRNMEQIRAVIAEAQRPPTFVGAIGRARWFKCAEAECLGAITEKDLRKFAHTTRYLFVGAYDGEGYLIWQKA